MEMKGLQVQFDMSVQANPYLSPGMNPVCEE